MNFIIKHKFKYVFLFIFFIGLFLRIYNINFDDLWIDEMSTFWIANPNINISESYKNNSSLELQSFFYNFIMRFYFQVFGYDVENSRYLSAVFSSLSILSVSYISYLISNKKSYLLTAFLISFNIFLISYAQELRAYSLVFFFISLSILFYLLILRSLNYFNIFFFILNILVAIFLHPFALILLFSIFTHIIINFFLKKNLFKQNHFKIFISSILFVFLVSSIYYIIHLKNLIPNSSEAYFFLENPNFKFLTNMFFSKFFGSRSIGILFLLLFLFAIIKLYKKILELREIFFLLIFFILSYIVPIIYGFLFHPIIQAKYIIFVIISFVLIISDFINNLKNPIKNFLIIFITIITLGNLITEQTIKQFFSERRVYKPEINKSLKLIDNSNYKNYLVKVDPYDNLREPWTNALNNYLEHLSQKNKYNSKVLKDSNKIIDYSWVICENDLNYSGCNDEKYNELEKVSLNRLTLILVSQK